MSVLNKNYRIKKSLKKSSFKKRAYQAFRIFFKAFGLTRKMDNYFQVESFSHFISPLYFYPECFSDAEKKAFFKAQLTEVVLETHAFCNRNCSFCPNSLVKRLDKNQIMPENVFKKVIDELVQINFSNTLKLHKFNEPLASEIIYDRIRYARNKLPQANIGFHSNGDYLTGEKLKMLEDIGLDFIVIGRYMDSKLAEGDKHKIAIKQCESYIQKMGYQYKQVPRDAALVKFKIAMDKLDALVFVPDTEKQHVDRGGLISQYSSTVRRSPCRGPFNGLFIDWTGDVLPCCNLIGDFSSHKMYILGNIAKQSLYEIFFSSVANKLRLSLVDFKPKTGACQTCNYDAFFAHTKETEKLMDKALKKIITKCSRLRSEGGKN